jgi:hypothetical protein
MIEVFEKNQTRQIKRNIRRPFGEPSMSKL